jgi:hypothetical protein
MEMQKIIEAVNTLAEVEVQLATNDTVVFTYEGVAIVASLTEEVPARLRFSVDVKALDIDDDDILSELMFKLLDLNTEIDPVAAAIDSTDPEKLMIQVRTTLRVVDLQDSEIVEEVKGLVGALGEVFDVVKEAEPKECCLCGENCCSKASPQACDADEVG